MKALTLHQPWAWAICYAGKDVENRTWRPPRWSIGRRIAIHAGLTWDAGAHIALQRMLGLDAGPPGRSSLPLGAVVGTAIVAGWFDSSGDAYGVQPQYRSPWYQGAVGWVLRDARPTTAPIPIRGHQGLWEVPQCVADAALKG